jgi:hypothetical protein
MVMVYPQKGGPTGPWGHFKFHRNLVNTHTLLNKHTNKNSDSWVIVFDVSPGLFGRKKPCVTCHLVTLVTLGRPAPCVHAKHL